MVQPTFRLGITLQDILDRPDFELSCLTATDRAPERDVLGIHMTDVPQPEQWLADRWILLTAGLQVRGRPAQQRHLVRRLVDQGVSGLGYCVGIATRQVPKAMLDEAERLGLPLFVVPYHIPVRIIIAEVNKMLLEAGDGLLGRSLATYDYLLAGFDSALRTRANPERQLVGNLSALLEIPVEQYTSAGEVAATEQTLFGLQPAAFDVLSRHAVTKLPHGTGSLLVCPCTQGDHHAGWLVARTPVGPQHEAFVAAAMSATARLVALSVLSRTHQPSVTRSLREQLLHVLLESRPNTPNSAKLPVDAPRQSQLTAMLADLGFAADQEISVLVCRPAGSEQASPDGLERVLDESGSAYLLARSQRAVTIVAQRPPAQAADLLRSARAVFGVASTGQDIFGTRVAADRAAFALRCAEVGLVPTTATNSCGGGFIAVDDLPLSLWAAEKLRDPDTTARAHTLVDALHRHPLVLEAIQSLLQHHQSIPATADALHLHPNSLRSRLRRAERIVGGSLRDPVVLSSVYLALVVTDGL